MREREGGLLVLHWCAFGGGVYISMHLFTCIGHAARVRKNLKSSNFKSLAINPPDVVA